MISALRDKSSISLLLQERVGVQCLQVEVSTSSGGTPVSVPPFPKDPDVPILQMAWSHVRTVINLRMKLKTRWWCVILPFRKKARSLCQMDRKPNTAFPGLRGADFACLHTRARPDSYGHSEEPRVPYPSLEKEIREFVLNSRWD